MRQSSRQGKPIQTGSCDANSCQRIPCHIWRSIVATLWRQFLARTRLADRSKFLDRKSTRLNSSHSQISYAVLWFRKYQLHHHSAQAKQEAPLAETEPLQPAII